MGLTDFFHKTRSTENTRSLNFTHDLPVEVSAVGEVGLKQLHTALDIEAKERIEFYTRSIREMGERDIDLSKELLTTSDGLVRYQQIEKSAEEQLSAIQKHITENMEKRIGSLDTFNLSVANKTLQYNP